MYINMVFESGGIKGLAYVGAIRYFEEHGYTCFNAVGTSVGAIFASLCVAGFRSKEIMDIIDNISQSDLKNKNTFKEGFKNKGIYNITNLELTLDNLLKKKGIETFQDVKFGNDYRLRIIVTDNKKKKAVIFPDELDSYGYNKDLFRISKAVVMSCSIPVFYSEYKYQNNRFVDGGATCMFPVGIIKNSKFKTYGFRVDGESILIKIGQKIFYKQQKNNKDYNDIEIININTFDIKSIQFLKGLENRQKLYTAGYESTKKFFQDKYK